MAKTATQPQNTSFYSTRRKRHAFSFINEDGTPVFSPVEQCHKDACDIDKIIATYDTNDLIQNVRKALGHYGDYTEVNEYQESLNLVMDAQRAFAELPSIIRGKFENDPGKFMEFVTNPANKDEIKALGLTKKEPKEFVQKVQITNEYEKSSTSTEK